jgi:hypothetical protein
MCILCLNNNSPHVGTWSIELQWRFSSPIISKNKNSRILFLLQVAAYHIQSLHKDYSIRSSNLRQRVSQLEPTFKLLKHLLKHLLLLRSLWWTIVCFKHKLQKWRLIHILQNMAHKSIKNINWSHNTHVSQPIILHNLEQKSIKNINWSHNTHASQPTILHNLAHKSIIKKNWSHNTHVSQCTILHNLAHKSIKNINWLHNTHMSQPTILHNVAHKSIKNINWLHNTHMSQSTILQILAHKSIENINWLHHNTHAHNPQFFTI